MGLRESVKRLEQQTGINEPCVSCAVMLPMPPDTKPAYVVECKCRMCGTSYLAHCGTAREAEALRRIEAYDEADFHRNPQARALVVWFHFEGLDEQQAAEAELRERATYDPQAAARLAREEKLNEWSRGEAKRRATQYGGELAYIDNLRGAELERLAWGA